MTQATPSIGGATGLDTGLSRSASKASLDKAGKQFEAVFTGMMLKSMRQAKLAEDELFGSKAGDTFRDMSDARVSQAMADHQPIGIGKAMTDFLEKSQSFVNADAASPPATS